MNPLLALWAIISNTAKSGTATIANNAKSGTTAVGTIAGAGAEIAMQMQDQSFYKQLGAGLLDIITGTRTENMETLLGMIIFTVIMALMPCMGDKSTNPKKTPTKADY